ncbi:MAG: flagellar basal body-associated FliL family protein [Lachnospiraceae bacterium]|nr:flagellar basal body-associated FliL family protein [Lachnospiraceae bacterium]
MKKNLISIIILALLIVNIILTSIMMLSVTSTNKKTADMVTSIASALDMELAKDASGEEENVEVEMKNTATYDIVDAMTIPLKRGADGKDHYYVVSVSLAMNIKDKGYKTYGETIAEKESLIKNEVIDVIGSYTLEEIQADTEAVKKDVLKRVQDLFDSEFIYQVAFSDVKWS